MFDVYWAALKDVPRTPRPPTAHEIKAARARMAADFNMAHMFGRTVCARCGIGIETRLALACDECNTVFYCSWSCSTSGDKHALCDVLKGAS